MSSGLQEKGQFVEFMRLYERFCGVKVVTYCVMSNHFHVLVEVPQRPERLPDDEGLLKLLKEVYRGSGGAGTIRQRLAFLRKEGADAEAYRERFFARMWDVSALMKLLKQRFTQWFNRTRGRKGTLWEERFKSVLVEGAGTALATMAAYIDMNPLRAGVVSDPKEYEEEGLDEQARPLRRGFTREEVKAVLASKVRLDRWQMLRSRVRYFTDGAALGTRNFSNEVFIARREHFGSRRQSGARPLRGLDAARLFAMRDLRVRAVG